MHDARVSVLKKLHGGRFVPNLNVVGAFGDVFLNETVETSVTARRLHDRQTDRRGPRIFGIFGVVALVRIFGAEELQIVHLLLRFGDEGLVHLVARVRALSAHELEVAKNFLVARLRVVNPHRLLRGITAVAAFLPLGRLFKQQHLGANRRRTPGKAVARHHDVKFRVPANRLKIRGLLHHRRFGRYGRRPLHAEETQREHRKGESRKFENVHSHLLFFFPENSKRRRMRAKSPYSQLRSSLKKMRMRNCKRSAAFSEA